MPTGATSGRRGHALGRAARPPGVRSRSGVRRLVRGSRPLDLLGRDGDGAGAAGGGPRRGCGRRPAHRPRLARRAARRLGGPARRASSCSSGPRSARSRATTSPSAWTEEIAHAGRSAREIAAAVRAAGGVGFAAHPFSAGGRMLVPRSRAGSSCRTAGRRSTTPTACDGIELWSLTTDAAEAWRTPRRGLALAARSRGRGRRGAARAPPAPLGRAVGAPARARRSAASTATRPGVRVRGRVRSPLSHARTFGLLRTHLLCERPLSGDAERDRATLLAALRAGAAWLSCPFVAPADGARLWAERRDGSDRRRWARSARRAVRCCACGCRARRDITVVRDGAPVHASARRARSTSTSSGPARLPRRGANRGRALAALQPRPPAIGPPEGGAPWLMRLRRPRWSPHRGARG